MSKLLGPIVEFIFSVVMSLLNPENIILGFYLSIFLWVFLAILASFLQWLGAPVAICEMIVSVGWNIFHFFFTMFTWVFTIGLIIVICAMLKGMPRS